MGEYIIGLFLGILVGLWICSMAYTFSDNNYSAANLALEQCELTIPRDQHCIITAVIDKEGE